MRNLLPALIVALTGLVGALLVHGWRDRLPDPVATHWGTSGTADGFSSVTGVVVMVAVTALIGALLCLLTFVRRIPAQGRRVLVGIFCGTAVFVIVLMTGLTGRQIGLADAADAPLGLGVMALAATAGVFAGLVAGAAARGDGPGPAAAPPIVGAVPVADTLPAGGAVWSGRSALAAGGLVTLALSMLTLVVVGVFVQPRWMLLIPALIIAVVLVVTGTLRVHVEPTRVQWAAGLGWPRIVIPVEQIERAEVLEVNALKDFGGWGYRIGLTARVRGATGFVLRSGPALMVVRTGSAAEPYRRDLVVVAEAASAAALINALVRERLS